MICPKCGEDGVIEGMDSCPNCGADIPQNPQPTTQITVTQEVKNAQGGKVTAVEIGEVKGDIRIDFRDKEEERDRRNKLTLLQKVRDFWIKGVLERSIHGAFLIEIGKKEDLEAVEHPWSKVLYTPDQLKSEIPKNKRIIEIFDDASQSLLILGEPGSGKTTEMLELARELIRRAEKDPFQPIPVVFNLSSWTDPKQTIVDWLIRELNEKYQVNKKKGRHWVENRDLMLLLDGLDEIKTENRVTCVEAINKFLQDGSCPIVVCSRIQEYQALKVLLKLNKAVLLQSLSIEQVESFLEAGGTKLSALKSTLKEDSALWELAKTPLMLSVMGFAYADQPIDHLMPENMDLDRRRKYLFNAYVDKMFSRESRSRSEIYSKVSTISWLSWLARGMVDNGQTVFLLERLQPTWLKTKKEELMFAFFGESSFCLIIAICLGLFPSFAALAEEGQAPIAWLIISLAIFLFFFIFVLLDILSIMLGIKRVHSAIKTKGMVRWSWKTSYKKLVGIINANKMKKSEDKRRGLKILYKILNPFRPIFPVISYAFLLFWFMLLAYIFFISGTYGFLIAVILLYGIISGFESMEIESQTYPNQGIYQTGKNSIILALMLFIVLSAFCGILIEYFYRKDLFVSSFISILPISIGLSLLIGYLWGGNHFIQHYVLRLTLILNKRIPKNYAMFLDQSVDHIFLQRVGGGYIFIHRMLMEYFAELEPEHSGKGNG